jgi:hypothetical protein
MDIPASYARAARRPGAAARPIAIWATPTANLQDKDKADAINATRQTLLAAGAGGPSPPHAHVEDRIRTGKATALPTVRRQPGGVRAGIGDGRPGGGRSAAGLAAGLSRPAARPARPPSACWRGGGPRLACPGPHCYTLVCAVLSNKIGNCGDPLTPLPEICAFSRRSSPSTPARDAAHDRRDRRNGSGEDASVVLSDCHC